MGLIPAAGAAVQGAKAAAVFVAVGILAVEIDLQALRVPYLNMVDPPVFEEPVGCVRLRGPVGAEDAVLLESYLPMIVDGVHYPELPPIIITGELDAAAHEFTNEQEHGTSAATSPRGSLWAIDRLDAPTPRLTRLTVPLPEGVTLHTHGLGLFGDDLLFAVNHGFREGGERIERWRITRNEDANGVPVDVGGAPVTLTHLGALTGHDGDGDGDGAWRFTERLNAGINDVAPARPWEVFFTQWLDAPAHLDGGATGDLEGWTPPTEGPGTSAMRATARALSLECTAKTLLPRLRRSRIWHCYCAAAEAEAAAGGGPRDAPCANRTVCRAIGPIGVTWNGIAYRADKNGRRLYVNDIFKRVTVEFTVEGEGAATTLEQLRVFPAPFLVDNVHIDASMNALWLGGVGVGPSFFRGIDAVKANASAAFAASRSEAETMCRQLDPSASCTYPPPPRPHLHLRPDVEAPPRPPMPSGALRVDLASGEVRVASSEHDPPPCFCESTHPDIRTWCPSGGGEAAARATARIGLVVARACGAALHGLAVGRRRAGVSRDVRVV